MANEPRPTNGRPKMGATRLLGWAIRHANVNGQLRKQTHGHRVSRLPCIGISAFVGVTVLLGCIPNRMAPPSNADPAECLAVNDLAPIAETVSWNAQGHVRTIDMSGSQISAKVLDSLLAFEHLEELNLTGCDIGTDTVARLSNLSELRGLSLQWTSVADEHLRHLAVLPNLTVLAIGHTAVSDAAIPHLRKMQQLKVLFAEDTQLSQHGLSELERALPECRIQYRDDHIVRSGGSDKRN